jgi:hypothetical protein
LRVCHLNRVEGHTGLFGRIGHAVQHARSVFLDLRGKVGEFLKCPVSRKAVPVGRVRFFEGLPRRMLK